MSNVFTQENYRPNQKQLPPLMTIYGEIGIGKSSFCAGFPRPFFFDFEERTSHIEGITRDTDFDLGIYQLSNWKQLINNINQLKDTEYKTIVFDGVTKLQNFLWQEVNKMLASEVARAGVSCAKDLTFGRGYSKAYELFAQVMEGAKTLQRNYKKTIIFVDHEKIKEDDQLAPNSVSFAKLFPECMNGVLKILLKESDYIFRLVEKINLENFSKNSNPKAVFKGLELLTDRKANPECFLKTSLPLPSKVKASYADFKAAYEEAYFKVHPKEPAKKIEEALKQQAS